MKKSLPLALLFSAAVSTTAFAQQVHHCGSHEYMQQELSAHPELQKSVDDLEEITNNVIASQNARNGGSQSPAVVVTIPVVFHVIYNTAAQNLSDSRIQEQMDVLNADYRKLNTDASLVPSAWQSIAADCEIQFCLAQRDPQGNATNGILHIPTTRTQFSMNDSMKFDIGGGDDIWDRNKYLNIWVCKLSGGILGYATFPGSNSSKDGVVLDYRYTGKTGASSPYNKGRTATHEVGHWLNLKHIWGDDGGSCAGSDNVSDTPNQAAENYGCFAASSVQTDNCTTTSPGVMWMNYMDYTDDACMYMFTSGQKTRMTTALNNTRSSLLTSNGCVPVGLGPDENKLSFNLSVYPSPTSGQFSVDFGYLHASDVVITVYNTVGEVVSKRNIGNIDEQKMMFDLTGHASGLYFVEVRTSSERAVRKLVLGTQN